MQINDIRILDLFQPVLTTRERELLTESEQYPVTLTSRAIIDAAKKETSLHEFGPTDFCNRLDKCLKQIDSDQNRTSFSRLDMFLWCVRIAILRLRLNDIMGRYPEIHDVQIRGPIFIIGPPRSGGTYLHGLLATDTRLNALRAQDFANILPPLETGPLKGPAQVLTKLVQFHERREILPHLAAMMPRDKDTPVEDGILQSPHFPDNLLEHITPTIRLQDSNLEGKTDYTYLENFLKAIQWKVGNKRWVLRWDDHCEQIGPLISRFPDATIVMTHRDPVAVIQSMSTMKAYSARLHLQKFRADQMIEFWSRRIENKLHAATNSRSLIPADNLIDVYFRDFIGNEIATAERIMTTAGFKGNEQHRQRKEEYIERNARGQNGRISYDFKNDFGIIPDNIRSRFKFYESSFPVTWEVKY